ncbi:PKD domain-containing protein [Amycolatopsis xylanica]|uniref:PKD domain-containing protein n=1 Tax=Amycolatopsis xylanica TaxID=589385 RepID=A0A1H3RNI5_9PSEU|nr:PKD domain-containing protein [Amycolatopsis xylanica]SDZ27227.1 PKD domain-containing protein [Amycolatopsis xylanica]
MLLSLRSRGRIAALTSISALLAVLTTGVANAAPPSNDDFDNSTAITALPFSVQQDTSEATKGGDDPFACQGYNAEGSVWFHYTATETGLLRATTAGSDHRTVLSALVGLRHELRGVRDGCYSGQDAQITFAATAGTTYHFQVSGYDVAGGALKFAVDTIAPAPNDAFGRAEAISSLPATKTPDLSTASFEADEPDSTCVYNETEPSVWYAYTTAGPALSVTAQTESYDTAVTVYTGGSLPELRQVACQAYSYGSRAVFRANPGTTYYVRVTGDHDQPVKLDLAEAPPLQAEIDQGPSNPTVFDNVRFAPHSWQTIDNPLSADWDFGDGTKAPASTEGVTHHYAADGVYPVTMRATSPDGRTATRTTQVTVNTHDVGITRFDTPGTARAGQSKPITVSVANARYGETVTVVLTKHDGTWWKEVGRLTLAVPARRDRTVQFPFSYTFTNDDALKGKATFRAVAELQYPVQDALPVDNEVIAIATTVKPRAASLVMD